MYLPPEQNCGGSSLHEVQQLGDQAENCDRPQNDHSCYPYAVVEVEGKCVSFFCLLVFVIEPSLLEDGDGSGHGKKGQEQEIDPMDDDCPLVVLVEGEQNGHIGSGTAELGHGLLVVIDSVSEIALLGHVLVAVSKI